MYPVKIEVLSLDGRTLFDSVWIRDQTVTWSLSAQSGRYGANGVYLYVVAVRHSGGKEQRRLGILALLGETESDLSLPSVGEFAQVESLAIPRGVQGRTKLARDKMDNYRIQRKPGRKQAFQTLLQLDADGKLKLVSCAWGQRMECGEIVEMCGPVVEEAAGVAVASSHSPATVAQFPVSIS